MLLYRRQPLIDSAFVRALLRQTRVAVVGLSGGGTQVARQLATFGFGEIIGIDAQRVTRDNMLATDEFGWPDVMLHRRKTATVKSKLRWINHNVRSTPNCLPEKNRPLRTLGAG